MRTVWMICAAVLLITVFPAAGLSQEAQPANTGAPEATSNSAEQLLAEEVERRREAEHAAALAEAKAAVIDAGNSRLENWIGLYGLLIAVIAAVAGFFTWRSAANAARNEVQDIRDQIDNLRKSAETTAGDIERMRDETDVHARNVKALSENLQVAIDAPPGTEPATEPTEEELQSLEEVVAETREKAPGALTADDFRLLLFDAAEREDWDDYVRLAQGMAYLHGSDAADRAFSLFAKAYGNARLGNLEQAVLQFEEYLERCADDDPNTKAMAFFNSGLALTKQAEAKSEAGDDEEAGRLWALAGEKYAAALEVKPDKHEALNNWGSALDDQAEAKSAAGDSEGADRLWALAGEKYAAALEVKPDFHDSLNNWAVTLDKLAKTRSTAGDSEGADRLWTLAGEKYAAALDVKPDFHDSFNNWGNALTDQAEAKSAAGDGEGADRLWALAGEKYAAALNVKPDKYEALSNWGIALANQADAKSAAGDGEGADRLWALAIEKYSAALDVKPDKYDALNNSAIVSIHQAQTKTGRVRTRLLNRARKLCEQANDIQPGSGSYDLACIAALKGDAEKCAHWLRDSKAHDMNFPGCDHIAADKDFDAVRDSEAFRQAMVDIGCAEAEID